MIAYLDTQVAVWLASGKTNRVSKRARSCLERSELLLSPGSLLEIEFLHEIGQSKLSSADILRKLEAETGLRLCDLEFARVAAVALDESWTRDPFDRLIVANAKARGFSALVSADAWIQQNYPRAVW